MFKITYNKGFHITFKNGCTVSVQFGKGNYCSNYHDEIRIYEESKTSIDAEVAIFDKNKLWITKEYIAEQNDPKYAGNNVIGHLDT